VLITTPGKCAAEESRRALGSTTIRLSAAGSVTVIANTAFSAMPTGTYRQRGVPDFLSCAADISGLRTGVVIRTWPPDIHRRDCATPLGNLKIDRSPFDVWQNCVQINALMKDGS
jgi:hypothetical protein